MVKTFHCGKIHKYKKNNGILATSTGYLKEKHIFKVRLSHRLCTMGGSQFMTCKRSDVCVKPTINISIIGMSSKNRLSSRRKQKLFSMFAGSKMGVSVCAVKEGGLLGQLGRVFLHPSASLPHPLKYFFFSFHINLF